MTAADADTTSSKQKLVHAICRRMPTYDPDNAKVKSSLGQRVMGRVLHELITRDPSMTVVKRLNGAELEMPANHSLISLLIGRPLYESELFRLLTFTAADRAPLKIIDVGANIGDTRARAPHGLAAEWLCIEAHPGFYALMEKNCRGMPDVCLEMSAVSDHDAAEPIRFHERFGTASIAADGGSGAVEVAAHTLDSILARHPKFADAAVFKTDTDGFEQRIFKGARGYLEHTKPRIYFECMSRHWRRTPPENTPTEDLNILSGFGYDSFLFYDENGYLFGVDAGGSRATVAALEGYTDAKRYTYFNVVAFHRQEAEAAQRFLASERAFFANR
ncbi:MAG TPA: FkbM family methyltransferase [Caulobacteraceae bacterium]|nr:FkbM family methyltransferase [Caulobacteraceae bacterium]